MIKKVKSKINFKKNPMKIPILLCDGCLHKKSKEFIVKVSDKWSYVGVPTPKGSASCHVCSNSLNEPSTFMREADLRGADLRGVNLRNAKLWDADLYGVDLRGADLRGADLFYTDLRNSDLSEVNLSEANIRNTNFEGVDIISINFTDANYDSYTIDTISENTKLILKKQANSW